MGPSPRWFSPWEVTRAFLFPAGTTLPAAPLEAWPLLGNSISPLQCAIGLTGVDLAKGRVERTEADSLLLEFVGEAVPLNSKIVEVRPGWVKLQAPEPDVDPVPSTPPDASSDESVASDDSRLGAPADHHDAPGRSSTDVYETSGSLSPISTRETPCLSP